MQIVRVVDFHDQLVGPHPIPLIDMNLGDVSVDAREHVDELVGSDIGRIVESDVDVLFQRCDRADSDNACFFIVGFGAAAETEHNQRGDRKENDHAEGDDGMLLDRVHVVAPIGIRFRPFKKSSTYVATVSSWDRCIGTPKISCNSRWWTTMPMKARAARRGSTFRKAPSPMRV